MRSIRTRVSRAALVLALSTAACARELPAPIPAASSEDAPARRGGDLQLATFGDARSIDPANVADGLAPVLVEAIFAGLVDYDADGKIQPDLAERWVVEDGGLTYRFHLREGVRFHDGEEVTAADVKRSAVRALHPSAPNPYASFFTMLVGYDALAARKPTDPDPIDPLPGITVDGRFVVVFHLKAPDATFLPLLALQILRPVCKSGGQRYVDTWLACGAGPFKLTEGAWQRGRSVRLVRHAGYFRPGLPYLDAVTWTFHENQTSQAFKFQRGDLDVFRDFTTPDLLKFQADPRWTPFGEYDGEKQVLGEAMNVEVPPFDNVEVRRAVSCALDRVALQKVRAGSLRVANQLVPPSVFGFDPKLHGQTFDLGAALEHMRRAGFPYDPVTKEGGYPKPVPYVVYKAGLQEFMGQVVAQQLERIGIRLELRVVNYPTFMALRQRRKATAIGPGFWTQDFPDALSFLEPLFHSKSIAEEDSNNWSFYANPRFDDLVDRAHKELDDARRARIYSEAQSVLIDDAPWAFSQNFRFYTQKQPYVRGHRTHPMWMHDVTRAWIDRATGPVAARALFRPDALAALLGARR